MNLGYEQFLEVPRNHLLSLNEICRAVQEQPLESIQHYRQGLLFLDSIGEATLDILEQLSHMGTGLDRAINAS